MIRQIVLDTNVLVAGLRSRRGASFRLLSLVGKSRGFEINLSVPLLFEYEDALKRRGKVPGLDVAAIDDVLDYLCSVPNLRGIYFLWRPFLRDPQDDMVLELAVEAGCDAIVTHNTRDFAGIDRFNVRALTPRDFLDELGLLK